MEPTVADVDRTIAKTRAAYATAADDVKRATLLATLEALQDTRRILMEGRDDIRR